MTTQLRKHCTCKCGCTNDATIGGEACRDCMRGWLGNNHMHGPRVEREPVTVEFIGMDGVIPGARREGALERISETAIIIWFNGDDVDDSFEYELMDGDWYEINGEARIRFTERKHA